MVFVVHSTPIFINLHNLTDVILYQVRYSFEFSFNAGYNLASSEFAALSGILQ